jgi:hypothetical protein
MSKEHRAKHRTHALSKASAVHLHRQGHITKDVHDEIVAHAEKNMAKANKAKKE